MLPRHRPTRPPGPVRSTTNPWAETPLARPRYVRHDLPLRRRAGMAESINFDIAAA